MSSQHPTDDPTLFPLVEGSAAPMAGKAGMGNRWRLAVIGFFLVVCGGWGLIDTLAPAEMPRLLGQEKIDWEADQASATVADGTRMRLFEKELKLRSRVRGWTSPLYTFALLKSFGSAAKTVVQGRGGWLFHRIPLAQNDRSDAELIEPGVRVLAALARRMSARGVRLIAMPIPRKAHLVESYLPDSVDPRPGIDLGIDAGLDRHGVERVALKGALLALEDEEAEGDTPGLAAWQPWDTHWSQAARLEAARLVAESLGVDTAGPHPSKVVRLPRTPTSCDLLRLVGLTTSRTAPSWLTVPMRTGVAIEGRPEALGHPSDALETMPRWALAGTSYTEGSYQTRLFEHYLGMRIWNGSKAGHDFLHTVSMFLAKTRELGLPEVLVVEFPVHQISYMSRGGPALPFTHTLMEAFTSEPAPPMAVLATADEIRGWVGAGAGDSGEWSLPAHHVSSSGDGVLSMRLTRKSGSTEVWYRCGSISFPVVWPAEATTVVVPVISLGSEFEPITLSSKLAIDFDVELVTDLDLDQPAFALAEHAREASGEIRWGPEALSSAEVPAMGEFGGLLLEFDGELPAHEHHDVTVLAESGKSLTLAVSGARAVLVNLGALRGDRVRSVTVLVGIQGLAAEAKPLRCRALLLNGTGR